MRRPRALKYGETETYHVDDFPVYAAAPDLLAALEKMLAFCDIDSDQETDWERTVATARAVVAKARN